MSGRHGVIPPTAERVATSDTARRHQEPPHRTVLTERIQPVQTARRHEPTLTTNHRRQQHPIRQDHDLERQDQHPSRPPAPGRSPLMSHAAPLYPPRPHRRPSDLACPAQSQAAHWRSRATARTPASSRAREGAPRSQSPSTLPFAVWAACAGHAGTPLARDA